MTVTGMREHISKVYDADKWHRKVLNMPDSQVIAIYHTMVERGQLPIKKSTKKDIPTCEQLNMFDLFELDSK